MKTWVLLLTQSFLLGQSGCLDLLRFLPAVTVSVSDVTLGKLSDPAYSDVMEAVTCLPCVYQWVEEK